MLHNRQGQCQSNCCPPRTALFSESNVENSGNNQKWFGFFPGVVYDSRRTIESRQEKGRQTSFVDLFDSGKMLGAITFISTASKGQIFFRRQAENRKAFFHDTGTGKLPRRPFFAIGRKEEDKIKKIFFDNIAKRTARP